MKFDNEDFWNTGAVTDLLFRLSGGKIADASASSTEVKTVVHEDVALMDALVLLCYEEMIADIRLLGRHWSVGVPGGVGVPALVKRVGRVWAARRYDVSGRCDISQSLDMLLVFGGAPNEFRPLYAFWRTWVLKLRGVHLPAVPVSGGMCEEPIGDLFQ